MPLQFDFHPEDLFPQAAGLLNIEIRLGLAIFFESPIDRFKRIIEMIWLGALVK